MKLRLWVKHFHFAVRLIEFSASELDSTIEQQGANKGSRGEKFFHS